MFRQVSWLKGIRNVYMNRPERKDCCTVLSGIFGILLAKLQTAKLLVIIETDLDIKIDFV